MTAMWQWTARLSLAMAVFVAACATGGGRGTATPIPDMQSIAGRWQGLLDGPSSGQEDFIEVVFNPDGTYRGTGARTIGVLDAYGRAQVRDGRLQLTGEKGATGTGTLFNNDGRRTLVVEMTGPTGKQFSARLTPKP